MKKRLKSTSQQYRVPEWVYQSALDSRIWEFLENYGKRCFKERQEEHLNSFVWSKAAKMNLDKMIKIYGSETIGIALQEVSYAWLRWKGLL